MRLSKQIFVLLIIGGLLSGAVLVGAQEGDAGAANASISGDANSVCALAVQEFLQTGDASAFSGGMTTGTMDAGSDDAAELDVTATEEAMTDTTGTMDTEADATATEEAMTDTTGTMDDADEDMAATEEPMTTDMTGTMDAGTTNLDLSAFDEGTYEIQTLIVGDNAVFVEFTFTTEADSDIASQLPEGATILTPAAAVFDCEADTVTGVRVYFDREEVTGGTDMDSAEGSDDMAGSDTLEATETAEMDMEAGDDTLAGADTVEGADTLQGADTVEGADAVEGADTVVGADTLAGIDAVEGADMMMDDPYALLDAITDDPEAYMGQTVTVAGPITEYAGGDINNGFIIVEEDLIGDDPALILGANADLLAGGAWEVGQQVIVTGVVRGMAVADLEAELGYDLADDVYAGWENYPVIVASEIAPYDPAAQ